ncbi:MAG: hypothetical protein PHH17_00010 [Candidatus Pacebacteria bacterium]|jgi:heme/copper-type cytochrome/quinol oxidase subunit 2|nr:hypothetical protein [Bacteroidales bacterium]MDD2913457.1 hypothetical protein [Candidatus Paceibacterota bacterium]MDD3072727.1 hypothetical protein [Candidatus Paceibacterota bacterium]MDD3728848.1 hypothetical protein [Candidatus Paceibacterota bacterium]MDD4201786.1 hypothetical protein [Candidatus Paceibacterota bacterium]
MNKKLIISFVVVFFVIIGGFFFFSGNNLEVNNTENSIEQENLENFPVKEFSIESYSEIIDGNFSPRFSLSEINVQKGDLVRIKIMTTSGMHDFKIDEFNVFSETPVNQEVVVEFIADKAGEFVYYCSKPMHRDLGQWGLLRISE